MFYFALFWASLIGLLASWEMALYSPAYIFYWFGLCLASSVLSALFLTKNSENWKKATISRLSIVLFSIGVLWWLLWIDFVLVKYTIPFILWILIVYLVQNSYKMGVLGRKEKLALFFGGTYFWSAISYGLLTVLGWKIWLCLLIFLASFGILIFSVVQIISDDMDYRKTKAFILSLFIGAEFFVVISWLPFASATLALILSVGALFVYDLIKYYVNPDLIRRRIIARKIIVYALFLLLALLSTPWH
ncbi:MAG: hypothetical protein CO042_00410 [Parcubacteria group bacterium CG_4_9_14_0_2_um_filter_41_8]|nr:MAG: hypothetical protein AUJ34_01035 [Parcubacteria group bacterium CG1_02_41_12]PIP66912.1 MAG: hypothetical protein COW93_03065 [Parcubacteria group bacterium CG22_combo_CG10-13_8_21_14_all_41_9]PIQ78004.1 MAG: hypothetical protein COV79_05665 [Parcubacteria group bacterium CG11_big_fil_rev_8_21_14_0_20_41_14]PIR56670.1 MAG: hypothetical protein COU72_05005 [Parcubacteria group bacterium CG10_big_fil_rev_8_21_14_0_10_41_35]PJC41067.1 MAG: hypothetical protein CO042_00410 [Parcubacteria gr